jgi:EAL domain-containing protein (putative c-di-GMP-specific phosphodiesterase class I)
MIPKSEIQACLSDVGPTIVYQPIVHLDLGQPIGAESLCRFTGQAYSTAEWFEAAEWHGLGAELEMRAVELTIATRSTWPKSWEMVCLNISPDRLVDPRLDDLLEGYAGKWMVLELTDQTELPDQPHLQRRLEQLRQRGLRVALSGLASRDDLPRLRRIQPEVIKLDTTLTTALTTNQPTARHFVEQVIADCRRDGVLVVAVGIETEEQLDMARSIGIEAVQGYHVGRPQSLDALLASMPRYRAFVPDANWQ